MKKQNKKIFFVMLLGSLLFGFFVNSSFASTPLEQCIASGGTGLSMLGNCQNCPTGKHQLNGSCVLDENYVAGTANEGDIYGRELTQPTGPTGPISFNYKLLEAFPGFFKKDQTLNDLPALILAIYKFGIWTVGIAGFFMLVVGGFMYMLSAGNTSSAGSAKKVIFDALIGIVAAFGAYVILYVINPELTKITIGSSLIKVNVEESEYGGTVDIYNGNGSTAGGCIKPVNAALARTNWVYSKELRGQTKNGIRYTDCSNFVEAAYLVSGCYSPGGTTAAMYPKGKQWNNKNDLKAGDALVRKGHVVLCLKDGCDQIIHAPGTGNPITIKKGDYFTSKTGNWANATVIRASSFCGSC